MGKCREGGDKCIRQAVEIKRLQERIAELEENQYVPGLLRCPKCEFELVSNNLNVSSGTITPRDVTEKCMNNCGPLWRVTYKEIDGRAGESVDIFEKLLNKADKRIAELEEALNLAHGQIPLRLKGKLNPLYTEIQELLGEGE